MVCAVIIVVFWGSHDNSARAHYCQGLSEQPIKSISWYKLCSPMVTVSSKTIKPLFTQITSSRTGFLSMRLIFHIFPGQQPPDLNNNEPLWGKLRGRYPPPPPLPELTIILQEEWFKISLASIQELYLSISRKLQAVLKANNFPTPY